VIVSPQTASNVIYALARILQYYEDGRIHIKAMEALGLVYRKLEIGDESDNHDLDFLDIDLIGHIKAVLNEFKSHSIHEEGSRALMCAFVCILIL
jgi:hypothetical protein